MMEPRSFKILKQGLQKEDKVQKRRTKLTATTCSLCPKDNGSVYSQQGKNILTGCTGLKLQAWGTVQKERSIMEGDRRIQRGERRASRFMCVCMHTGTHTYGGSQRQRQLPPGLCVS